MNTFEFAKSEIKEILYVLPSLRKKREVSEYKTLVTTFERFVSSIRHIKTNDADILFYEQLLLNIENEMKSLGEALIEERIKGNYKEHHSYTVSYEKLANISRDLKYSISSHHKVNKLMERNAERAGR